MAISIIIPYYNREKFLQRTLDSVAEQTLRPNELILVDNGSTDNSFEICKSFAKKYNDSHFNIKLIRELRKGACAARNTGADHATHNYIYFFDSDDIMSPNFCEEINNYISNETKYDLIAFRTNIVLPNGKKYKRKSYFTTSVEDQIILSTLSTQSCIFKKSFFERIGKWDESLPCWNDWELGIRIMLSTPNILWIKDTTYHSIISHPESITGICFSKRYEQITKAINQAEVDVRNNTTALKAITGLRLITAGNFYREGSKELSKQMLLSAFKSQHKIPFQKLFSIYCQKIGIGAWWIYKHILTKFSETLYARLHTFTRSH